MDGEGVDIVGNVGNVEKLDQKGTGVILVRLERPETSETRETKETKEQAFQFLSTGLVMINLLLMVMQLPTTQWKEISVLHTEETSLS